MAEQTKLKFWIRAHMTQREFARQMGLSETYVSQLITGALPVTDSFRGTFARVYGHEAADQVFNGNGHAEAQPE